MTSEQARAAFDAAIDGELASEQLVAFEEALARDEALRADYERHRSVLRATASLDVPSVDLLGGVQYKLRARSGGRFYRDRFAERRHERGLSIVLVASALLLAAVTLWFAYQYGLF